MRNDGVSVVALIIVLLLLSALGVVFSSLIITKQKSAQLLLKSAQSFYLAQAGIGYAIRYTAEHYGDFQADPASVFPVTKTVGAGSFNITYNEGENNITSTGMAGTAKRVIILASFRSYLASPQGITLASGTPPYQGTGTGGDNKNIYIPAENNYDYDVYVFRMDLAKEGGNTARMNVITLGNSTVWTGNKVEVSSNPDMPTPFPFNQVAYYTMAPGVLLDRIQVQATSEVSGTWHLTFHYSAQTDLSGPETSTIIFVIS
jgi:type II secretory pathway pseudopilin PulG